MHDDDLRSRLIEAGVGLLGSAGPAALTLREIARRAGVSHGAPRRHFPTHVTLLSAIAGAGFADLGARVAEVVGDDSATPREQLLALAHSYVDFAASNRGMFELMFRHDLLDSDLGLRERSLPLFGMLVDLVARARSVESPPSGCTPEILAGALWTNLHGVAQLWVWGSLQIAVAVEDVAPVLRTVLDAYLGPEDR